MSDKNNNNDDDRIPEYLVDEVPVLPVNRKKREYTIDDEQKALVGDIQRISQEELQYVMDNLEEFEGMSEKAIHLKVLFNVRKRCVDELGIEFNSY